jgi:hypothetical protein
MLIAPLIDIARRGVRFTSTDGQAFRLPLRSRARLRIADEPSDAPPPKNPSGASLISCAPLQPEETEGLNPC